MPCIIPDNKCFSGCLWQGFIYGGGGGGRGKGLVNNF